MSKPLPEVFEAHNILDADLPKSGKGCVIKLKSGVEIHCDLAIKETVMSDGRRGVFEQNIADSLDEYMSAHYYDVAVKETEYQQQQAVYNREITAAGERLESLMEMGVVKYELQQLPRMGKMLVKLQMTNNAVNAFYADYSPLFDDDEYIKQAVEHLKSHQDLWSLPSDGKQLAANASIINKPAPSKILKL